MEPWFSGAVVDAVREAKSRQALFIVYVRDDSQASQSTDDLWSNVWTKLNSTLKMIALRLDKDSEACLQFNMIYKVEVYPTIYFINGRNGQVLKKIDRSLENADELQQVIEEALNIVEPKEQSTKSIEEKVADARARLKEIQEKRDDETKAKEREDEINRRRLGQQMLLDKQKKDEELIRKQAEEIRRDKVEQQKLQEKLKAQIQQDREEKRRKYEQKQSTTTTTTTTTAPSPSVQPKSSISVDYSRSRLQFRLADGSFFTEDFSSDAHMSDVYAYLEETLPRDQYRNGSYILRTVHTRLTLTRDNPNTLKQLELAPSTVLLVIKQAHSSPSTNVSVNNIFQSIPLLFTWLMMQFNFLYQFLAAKLFGQRPTRSPSATNTEQGRSTTRINNRDQSKSTVTKRENFRTDSTDKSTIRRFHNTQDDSDDEEKRTWNGNSTQQM